jgi:hypothetical protein
LLLLSSGTCARARGLVRLGPAAVRDEQCPVIVHHVLSELLVARPFYEAVRDGRAGGIRLAPKPAASDVDFDVDAAGDLLG